MTSAIAAAQFAPGADRAANLADIRALTIEARDRGAPPPSRRGEQPDAAAVVRAHEPPRGRDDIARQPRRELDQRIGRLGRAAQG